jgi:hypothetical protein
MDSRKRIHTYILLYFINTIIMKTVCMWSCCFNCTLSSWLCYGAQKQIKLSICNVKIFNRSPSTLINFYNVFQIRSDSLSVKPYSHHVDSVGIFTKLVNTLFYKCSQWKNCCEMKLPLQRIIFVNDRFCFSNASQPQPFFFAILLGFRRQVWNPVILLFQYSESVKWQNRDWKFILLFF